MESRRDAAVGSASVSMAIASVSETSVESAPTDAVISRSSFSVSSWAKIFWTILVKSFSTFGLFVNASACNRFHRLVESVTMAANPSHPPMAWRSGVRRSLEIACQLAMSSGGTLPASSFFN